MRQILSLVLLLTLSMVAKAQAPSNYTNINGRYRWIAGMFDSTFHIPKGTTPSLRTGGSTNAGAVFYNTSDSSVYTYTGTQWIKLRGTIIDTTSLSNRINLKLNISDTASMLSPYLRKVDTTNKFVTQVYKKSGSDSVFYVRGGNHLWAFNDSSGAAGGGGGGKIYYFNGGVSMGTFGGFTMYELGDTANTGAAANFTRATTGNIANFITDPGKPGLLQIPSGVWSVDAWLSETGGGSNHAEIYVIVEKWNGSTISTIATSPIEQITEGNSPNLYTWSVSIPTTTLAVTDRIIIQFYIQNTNGKTVTLYTQNGYVGEVHTTFTTGIGAINGLTAPAQYLVTGTSGTDFNISSVTATHTFNLPTASATNRGALSTTDWSTFNNKIGPSDTASMLSPYLRKVDTASLSNRINLKVNISDTASMLSPYLRSNVASATYVPQSRTITINGTSQDLSANRTFSVGTVTSVGLTAGTGISVSGSPVTGSGSMTVTNTAPDQTVVLNSGTGISISGTYPSFTITNSSPSSGGTVTSVGTNNGTGLTGGTITTAGTLAIDTSLISTRLWRQKGIDSVQSNLTAGLALKVNISDTSSMLSPYLRKIDTTAMLSPYARKNFINAGTGISYSSVTGTIANTAPDQTVAISSGTGISVTGTYPNFTITNTSPSSGGTVTSVATNNGTGITGGTITSAGTLAIDTVVISTRAWRQKGIDSVQGNLTTGLATKLNISDTASMLSPYLRKVDTASLSNRINLKVNISDTASMLGNYVNNVGYGLTKAGQVVSADSATLSAYYLRRKDSLTSTNLLGYVTRRVLADSAAAIRAAAGGGSISGSGTTNYIPKFTSSTAVGNSRFFDNGTITFLGNGDVNASPSTAILSGTGGSGTNIAGAEFRIRGGAGTGTGVGGPITFYTSAAGTTGSAVNAPVEAMRITGAGAESRIGLGTNNPTNQLHISSSTVGVFARLQSTADQAGVVLLAGTTGTNRASRIDFLNANSSTTVPRWTIFNDYLQNGTNDYSIVNASNTRVFSILQGGSVGIGTTTIGSTLQVNGNAAIGYSASTAAPTNGLAVSGSVGIGTTTPNSPLTIAASAAAIETTTSTSNQSTYARFVNTANTNTAYFGLDGTGLAGIENGAAIVASSANRSIILASALTNRLTITSSGQVTLSTGSNVSAIAQTGYSLTGSNASSLIDLAGTWNTTGNPTAIKLNITNTASGATAKLIDLQVGGTSEFVVDKAGYTGINTGSPNSFLHVAGSLRLPITTKTATYTLDATDYTVVFDLNGNATANLPDATTIPGRIYVIKINRTNVGDTLTIDPNGAQTIDGNATLDLLCQQAITIQSDGTNWRVIGDYLGGLNCL